MSIVRHYGQFTPTCDICGDELQAQESFQEAVLTRNEADWKSQKNSDGEWEDICRKCQNGGEDPGDES